LLTAVRSSLSRVLLAVTIKTATLALAGVTGVLPLIALVQPISFSRSEARRTQPVAILHRRGTAEPHRIPVYITNEGVGTATTSAWARRSGPSSIRVPSSRSSRKVNAGIGSVLQSVWEPDGGDEATSKKRDLDAPAHSPVPTVVSHLASPCSSGPGAGGSGGVLPQTAHTLKLWPPSTRVIHWCRPNLHASFFIRSAFRRGLPSVLAV
jgi:hypothetical protein